MNVGAVKGAVLIALVSLPVTVPLLAVTIPAALTLCVADRIRSALGK